MSDLKVLLIGASGSWGRPLVEEFIKQKSSFGRIAILARSEEHKHKFEAAQKAGIEIVIGSFLDPKSYEGFNTVLSLVGNPVLRLQPAMIEAAVQAGVKHFYPSEWNSDIDQPEIAGVRYFRDKQATRAHLDAVAKEYKDFRYTIFITGIFTEWTLMLDWDHENRKATVYGNPENRVGSTSIPDIARYTVASLLLDFTPNQVPQFPGRRTLRVQGGSKPYKQVVADLEAARGGQKYEIDYRNPLEALDLMEKARQNGDEAGEMLNSLRTLPASGFGVADGLSNHAKLDNDLFDFKPETQRETFERVWKN